MSGAGGSPSEMPILPRLGARRSLDAAAAERLLTGRGPTPDAPAGQQAVARLLEIAASPASGQELAGEAAAVAAFTQATTADVTRRAAARRGAIPGSRGVARLALAVAACLTAISGTAAYAGALPAPVQELAHIAFGAPAPRHSVPAPRRSSQQPAHQGIHAESQAGHQKAGVKGQEAHPNGTAAGRQKSHSHKAHPRGHPGHREIPQGHPAKKYPPPRLPSG